MGEATMYESRGIESAMAFRKENAFEFVFAWRMTDE